jgi:hypothetical protein
MRGGREQPSDGAPAAEPGGPRRFEQADLPPIPPVDESKPDRASVQLSQYRTRLSTHRTELSMRRTGMSFQRTRLSAERRQMAEQGLIHAEMAFPVSFTLITAVLLLLLGAAAIISMAFNIGPLG